MKPSNSITTLNICFLVLALALTFSLKSFAGLIDFETTASGLTPVDNAIIDISDKFMAGDVSVSFGFDTNGDDVLDSNAVFEQVKGGKESGNSGFMSSYSNKYDIAATGLESLLGSYFLRQQSAYKPFGTFHIIYDAINPVTSASGEIWDIDGSKGGTEQFRVEAFNGKNSLASILSPLGNRADGNSLDGKPWAFGFKGLSDITRIEISFTGSKTKGIGLAFNNFSPVEDVSSRIRSVSEPSTIIVFGLAMLCFAISRYRKSR